MMSRARSPAPLADRAVLSTPGHALDAPTRSFLERQLGREPGRVQSLSMSRPVGRTPDDGEAGAERAAKAIFSGAGARSNGWRHDFSAVRVHSDAASATGAQAQGAEAYAVGHHLVFGRDRYRPDTPSGLRLLAHELAHLLQQGGDNRQSLDRFEARVHESVERVALTEGGAMGDEEASAVYFGNWMRDMNQVLVPALVDMLPADVVFSLISYMAATRFGRELTPEQFGYYIPAEHLDNPAGLVKGDDFFAGPPTVPAAARPALPGRLGATRPAPLDTPQEDVDPSAGTVQGTNLFAVDQTGVMAYVRRTNLHVERRLELAASTGRNPDGMHHFGAALHAIEDLFAHSNFVEIAVDRLLRTDPKFLPELTGSADRQVFTYSQRAKLPPHPGQDAEERPVLTTGTFTGPDTLISLSSELVGVLSRPLPPPASNEETHAQDRLMVALLRNFETRLRSNAALRALVSNTAQRAGVPKALADKVDKVPLATIYETSTILKIDIPDAIRIPFKKGVRDIVSTEVLQPIAGRVRAAGLEARVADTSLISVLRDSKRQEGGNFTDTERASMREQERLTGSSVAVQEATKQAQSKRRAQAIRGTPLHVVAGPSHSQLAKDHSDSPFFGLAFQLANVADQRLRGRMLAVWADRLGAATKPFDFDWGANYPPAPTSNLPPAEKETYEEARRLFHAGRPQRGKPMAESLKQGRDVVAHGGTPGQPFDLSVMRKQAAGRIRDVAAVLRALGGAPSAAAQAITKAQGLAGAIDGVVASHLKDQLARARAAAAVAGASQTVTDLNTVADTLGAAANAVEAARRHDLREKANAALVAQRQLVLSALAGRSGVDVGASAALLYVLDQEVQATAVAYTSEQRAVLEGKQSVAEMGNAPRGLTVAAVTLPPLTGTPATVALMTESRTLLAHPYENAWWEPHVRAFATAHRDQLINDIEARNEGVPLYRGAPTP